MDHNEWVTVAKAEDGGCIPHFYWRAIEQKAETRKQGRPIFKDRPYVKILIPGQNKSVPDRPVTDSDKQRWPRAWAAFEQNAERVDGTPIEEWPYLRQSRVAELRAMNIVSVEQVAALDHERATKIGLDGTDLVSRARHFIDGDSEAIRELRAENEQLSGELETLQRENESLRAYLAENDIDINTKGGAKA